MTATYIGETTMQYVNGKTYAIQTQNMTGRRYKDRTDLEGEPDNRIMLWNNTNRDPALKVYDDQAAIAKDWKFIANW